ncbi:MAG: hypothetical protein ACLP05_00235 [Candidatus Kryptoniota bacterium]
MELSYASKLMCGVILITIPTIEYGGFFLLSLLKGKFDNLQFNEYQKIFFRAGHAHAGVLVILSLVCQVLVDSSSLPSAIQWMVRAGVPLAGILVPAGFFLSVLKKGSTKPNGVIALTYIGIVVLALSVITLGVGLLLAI